MFELLFFAGILLDNSHYQTAFFVTVVVLFFRSLSERQAHQEYPIPRIQIYYIHIHSSSITLTSWKRTEETTNSIRAHFAEVLGGMIGGLLSPRCKEHSKYRDRQKSPPGGFLLLHNLLYSSVPFAALYYKLLCTVPPPTSYPTPLPSSLSSSPSQKSSTSVVSSPQQTSNDY